MARTKGGGEVQRDGGQVKTGLADLVGTLRFTVWLMGFQQSSDWCDLGYKESPWLLCCR